MPVSFALFDTLVSVTYPAVPDGDAPDETPTGDADPGTDRDRAEAARVADALRAAGVAVPTDWAEAYRETHVEAPPGAAVPLPAHVARALASRGVEVPGNAARRAVVNAFDPRVETREGAVDAVAAAGEHGPVGLLTNCRVPELVPRVLVRSALPRDAFEAVVTAAGCGWRKPDRRAFDAVAQGLGVPTADLVHVGADPNVDGGVVDAGGEFVDVGEVPLVALRDWLDARG